MYRILFTAAFALLLVDVSSGQAQQLLKTDGYGSLSGKVTLVGKMPDIEDFTKKMMLNADKACCLHKDAKDVDKIDQQWIIDPKTKAVKNVMVWVMPPKNTYFEIHFKSKKRKETIILDQPFCAFTARVTAFNPVYYDGKQLVPTGQQLIIKNSASVPHNVHAIGSKGFNDGFNRNMPPKSEFDVLKDLSEQQKINPQLLPLSLSCGSHTWMHTKLYVFDHPYYAMTDAAGKYDIPFVPAGAEIRLYAHHEGVGWVSSGLKQGQAFTIKKGEKATIDFELKAPPEN